MGISSFSVGLGIGRLPFFFNYLALVPLRVVVILRVEGAVSQHLQLSSA
ncbi:MAG: hypothetical protein V3W37_05680 [Candidatus Binatia bacterium]